MVRAICGMQLDDGERCRGVMLLLVMSETADQLVMRNSVHWYVR